MPYLTYFMVVALILLGNFQIWDVLLTDYSLQYDFDVLFTL